MGGRQRPAGSWRPRGASKQGIYCFIPLQLHPLPLLRLRLDSIHPAQAAAAGHGVSVAAQEIRRALEPSRDRKYTRTPLGCLCLPWRCGVGRDGAFAFPCRLFIEATQQATEHHSSSSSSSSEKRKRERSGVWPPYPAPPAGGTCAHPLCFQLRSFSFRPSPFISLPRAFSVLGFLASGQ